MGLFAFRKHRSCLFAHSRLRVISQSRGNIEQQYIHPRSPSIYVVVFVLFANLSSCIQQNRTIPSSISRASLDLLIPLPRPNRSSCFHVPRHTSKTAMAAREPSTLSADSHMTGDTVQANGQEQDHGATEKSTMNAAFQKDKNPAPAPAPAVGWSSDAPNGGARAWLVVAGAWCTAFCSFGWLNSEAHQISS